MIKRQALPIACCFFFASMGYAQSLADLAKKEKERRQQIQRARESLKQGRPESVRPESSVPGGSARGASFFRPSTGDVRGLEQASAATAARSRPCEGELTKAEAEKKNQQGLYQGIARVAVIDTPCRQVGVDRNGVLLRVPPGGLKGGPAVRQTGSPVGRRPAAARATPRTPRGGMRYSGRGMRY